VETLIANYERFSDEEEAMQAITQSLGYLLSRQVCAFLPRFGFSG
jgi:hypothetical protein